MHSPRGVGIQHGGGTWQTGLGRAFCRAGRGFVSGGAAMPVSAWKYSWARSAWAFRSPRYACGMSPSGDCIVEEPMPFTPVGAVYVYVEMVSPSSLPCR